MRVLAAIFLLCSFATAVAQTPVPAGEITAGVAALKDPSQRYAAYVPSAYTSARSWPVILAFDPAGNGTRPVEQFRQAAEKFGYIVLGSHNSRNGPIEPSVEALRVLWDDMQARFSVDMRRIYTAGFSGGSRIATLSAVLCNNCVAGVIACGAGFPVGYRPSAKIHFSYFSIVGDEDFNYPELAALQNELDRLGIANARRVFPGPHQWPAPEVLTEAVTWMELQAMRRQLRPRDESFISAQLAQANSRALDLENRGDTFAALQQYKGIATTFDGLADIAPAAAKISALERQPAIGAARKREADQLKREQALNLQLRELAGRLINSERDRSADTESRAALQSFKTRLQSSSNPDETKSNTRVLGSMFAMFAEQAQAHLRKKEYLSAAMCLEIASEVRTLRPALRYTAARAYAMGGDKKNALRSLRQAVAGGFNDVARIEGDEELKSIRETREYREVIASLKAPGNSPEQ